MSCALPELVRDSPTSVARVDLEGKLRADLANGLHAMAQPLTVLRGAIEALVLLQQIAPDNRRYFEMSIQQTERLCDLMNGVQNLLEFHQTEAECVPLELWDLIAPLLDEQRSALQKLDVQIAAAVPDRPWHVFADATRTEQTLRAALLIAASGSKPGGTIEVAVRASEGFASLIIQNRNDMKSPDCSDRLRLSIIDAGMHSQQGFFSLNEEPLRLSLGFPLQPSDDLRGRLASHGSPLPEVTV